MLQNMRYIESPERTQQMTPEQMQQMTPEQQAQLLRDRERLRQAQQQQPQGQFAQGQQPKPAQQSTTGFGDYLQQTRQQSQQQGPQSIYNSGQASIYQPQSQGFDAARQVARPGAAKSPSTQAAVIDSRQLLTTTPQPQPSPAVTTEPGLPTTPTNVNQFQRWVQTTYGTQGTPQQLQQIAEMVGITDPNNITPQQMQQAQAAMASLMQQQGNLGAIYMPGIPNAPGPMQNITTSMQQGRDLIGPAYQPSQQAQDAQTQAYRTTLAMQQQGPMTFQGPQGGPTPDFNQQQALINQLTAQQGPQINQGLFNQQQQSINAMQGMQAGQFQAQGGALTGQAAGAAGQLMQAGPLVGQFQAPEQIAQAERNRTLQAIMGSPDVFGAREQAQMGEQQKEQLLTQQREAEGRLGQLMAQRGLSARGGTELAGQMGLQENLISGLLAGQRDIALRAAEANRAARLGAVNAVTGAQQADLGMASQAFQTGLQGAQANRAAQVQATELGAQLGNQQFQQGLAGYQAGLEGQRFNLTAQQAAQQAASGLAQQNFGQQLAGAEFGRAGVQAALTGTQNMGQQQMAQNQQTFNQALAGQQFNLSALGQQQQNALAAAGLGQQINQQGFQNYLAQAGLGLQGFSAAEAAAASRQQMGQQDYLNMLDYLLRARGQEQNYGLGLAQLGMNQQLGMARLGGF